MAHIGDACAGARRGVDAPSTLVSMTTNGFVGALALAALVLVVAVVVLGPTKRFERTWLGVAYAAASDGLPVLGARALGVALCSRARGDRAAAWCRDRVLDAPNPFGQCVYLALVLGGHASFVEGVETRLLDAGDGGGWTMATGAVFTMAVVTWIAACCSDPGTITRDNVEKHLAAYAYDDVIYHRKVCRTLEVDAPARSKWCVTTERRVAKFDHFCVWINNTVGCCNFRYFLAFLAGQLTLVTYVAYACARAVTTDMARRDVWSLRFQDSSVQGATLWSDKAMLYRFVVYYYGPAFALGLFCGFLTVVLSVFLGYNVYLAARNVTTNETFKWDMVHESVALTKESDAKEKDAKKSDVDWDEVTRNRYDRGVSANLMEVVFPPVIADRPWRVPATFPSSKPKVKKN